MNQLQKHIDEAYKLISAFAVKGDGVDLIAGVRAHLRQAYALAADRKEETDQTTEQEG